MSTQAVTDRWGHLRETVFPPFSPSPSTNTACEWSKTSDLRLPGLTVLHVLLTPVLHETSKSRSRKRATWAFRTSATTWWTWTGQSHTPAYHLSEDTSRSSLLSRTEQAGGWLGMKASAGALEHLVESSAHINRIHVSSPMSNSSVPVGKNPSQFRKLCDFRISFSWSRTLTEPGQWFIQGHGWSVWVGL